MNLINRSAFASQNFRIYFYGNILSVVGIWVQRLSLGWHAWQLSESAFIVGLIAAAQYLPLLLLTPFFGVFADQYQPRLSAVIMHIILMFIALILSIIIMFCLHQLQQSQERLVLDCQRYCNRNLLQNLTL